MVTGFPYLCAYLGLCVYLELESNYVLNIENLWSDPWPLFFDTDDFKMRVSLAVVAQWEHGQLGSNFQSFREFKSLWERKNFAQKFVLLT